MICWRYIGKLSRAAALLLVATAAVAAPRRVLYVTHSAGFRHDTIPLSQQVMEALAASSRGVLEVVSTEDLSLLSAGNLRNFDVVFFFTTGELALSNQQKQDLLAWVRDGKGFGGVHSATDTLYAWPDYGELIGGYFDDHPWAQEAGLDVEDPAHPITANLPPSFRITEEFYQFRNFSRDRVRVLLTLDTSTVDLNSPRVHRTDGDFALAWCRNYGRGRVYYNALGHFEGTWRDARFQSMLLNGLLWLAGEVPGDATPRSGTGAPAPAVARGGVVNAASFAAAPDNFLAPGALISIFGADLTSGTTWPAVATPLPVKLAGTTVTVNGIRAPLLYVSPRQINAQLPFEIQPGQPAELFVSTPLRTSIPEPLKLETAAPGIFVVVGARRVDEAVSIYATGLGAVEPPVPTGAAAPFSPLSRVPLPPEVTIAGRPAATSFAGLAPGFVGLYQINAVIPAGLPAGPAPVMIQMGDRQSNPYSISIEP